MEGAKGLFFNHHAIVEHFQKRKHEDRCDIKVIEVSEKSKNENAGTISSAKQDALQCSIEETCLAETHSIQNTCVPERSIFDTETVIQNVLDVSENSENISVPGRKKTNLMIHANAQRLLYDECITDKTR